MVKLLLIILFLFCSNLFASEFYLNPFYEKQLKTNSKSYRIVKDYVRFLNTLNQYDNSTKIIKVNNYINALVSKYDAYNYKNVDYWATPFEFLTNGGGDCEDYAIAKKYTLQKVGIPSDNMYFDAVKDKFGGGDHMVLVLHVDKDNPLLVLDNLSFKVLSIDKRVDLKTVFVFNETGFFKLNNKQNLIKRDKIRLPQYESLKKRYKKELILQR